jgi:apolipoprotein N-acyltransferase
LWTYWTLLTLFFGWMGIYLLLGKKRFQTEAGTQNFLLATCSGLLLALAFPWSGLPTGFLALFAWIPLLLALERMEAAGRSIKAMYGLSLHTFMIWNLVATYWVTNSSLPAGLFAILVNSALMGIPVVLAMWVRPYLTKLAWVPLLAFWLCFEQMHYVWELNWPWLALGNVWATAPALVQWYAYTGVLGGTLWIFACNFILKKNWQAFRQKSGQWTAALSVVLIVILPMVFSLVQYANYEEQGPIQEIVVGQPNVEPFYERPLVTEAVFTKRLIDLSLSQASDQTQYIVFPEATLDFAEQDYLQQAPQVVALREQVLGKFPQAKIVIGTDAYRFLKPNEEPTRYSRKRENEGVVEYFEVYNAAIQMDTSDAAVQFYKKSKLVPGAELFPYPKLLAFLKPLVESLGGTMAGRGAQKERAVFSSTDTKIAPAICYESVFGAHLAAHVRNGAEAIFIVTNDAWWDHTAGHIQHFHYARLRAVENRRSVARAANTGISGFINQRGDVLQRSRYRETTALKEVLQMNSRTTYYTKNPGGIARFALFAAIAFLLNGFVKARMPGK